MKKIVSIILAMVVCVMSFSAFAAEDMDYAKSFKYVSVRLAPIDAPEAVLVVGEYKSGKLVGMEIVNIAQPDDGYTLPSITMDEECSYTFFVYDNLKFENELFNRVTVDSKTPNRLFLAEYDGIKFERVE